MFLNYFRNGLLLGAIISQTGFAPISFAEAATRLPDKAVTDLVVSEDKGTELQLEVRDTPLPQVLESIVQKTKIPIHYSVLPEGLVTATCVGSSLRPVLECLLDRKADLIVRYLHDPDKTDNKEQVAEAWILGARLDGATAKKDCLATSPRTGSLSLKEKDSEGNDEADQTDELIKAAQAKDPTERAEAIGGLLSGGREGDPAVKAVLEQALTDQDENVRAQAISSLAHREGSGASAAIQEALHDKSVDVRMMAVDGITDDKALLQQAINDSDETVRSLARVKLDELTQADKTAP